MYAEQYIPFIHTEPHQGISILFNNNEENEEKKKLREKKTPKSSFYLFISLRRQKKNRRKTFLCVFNFSSYSSCVYTYTKHFFF